MPVSTAPVQGSVRRLHGTSLACQFLKLQAMVLLACGQRIPALRALERMLLLKPSDAYALASQAHVQAQLGQLAPSITSLQQLTTAWPQQAAGWFNLGFMLQQQGRHEEARPAFERALTLEPRLDRAWYGLGLTLLQQRQFHDAAQALQKNTELQPLSPYGWYRLAQAWMGLGETAKARKVIAHLRRFEPHVADQLEREHAGLLREDCAENTANKRVQDAATSVGTGGR